MANLRAALYIRVSSDEQAKHGLSLDEQKHDLKEYASKHGYTVIGEYVDEGTTARKSLQRRKELQRLNLNIRLSIAQNESDQTSDRIKFVFEGKKRRREVLTGNVPYGYKIENKHFAPDAEKAAAIRDIFEHFLISQSVLETTTYAREKHGITWRHISMRRALQNERYIGTFYDIEDYTPGIIDKETFYRVQKVLTARRIDTPRKPSVPFLFSGLIHCPECGHILAGNKGHKYPNQTEYINKRYRCGVHQLDKTCTFSGTIFERPLEKYLLDNLKGHLHEYATTLQQKRKTAESEKTARKIKGLRDALDRLKDLYVTGCIDRAAYDKDFIKYNTQLQEMLKAAPLPGKKLSDSIKRLLEIDIESTYSKLTQEGKRLFWHGIIHRIDITHYEKGRGGKKEFRITFL